MRRVIVKEYGGPEQLAFESMPTPRPAAGQLLVEVEAAGVNYVDIYQRTGMYKVPLPFTPGFEGVGRIREAGDGVESSLMAGRRVAWINLPGSYAEQMVIPAAQAIPVPDSFTTSQALLFQAVTVQYLVREYGDVSGARVLVHAAAGGVGLLLVQWLKRLGAWVVGTTSSDEKAAAVRAAGADAVINYGRDAAFLDELLALTDRRGVDLAFDSVGAATLETTLQALSRGGTVVSYGSASGRAPAIEPGRLIQRCLRLAGGSVFSYVAEPAELQRRAAEVIDAITAGWLQVGEGTAFDFDAVAEAHRAIESRSTKGKLYLRM